MLRVVYVGVNAITFDAFKAESGLLSRFKAACEAGGTPAKMQTVLVRGRCAHAAPADYEHALKAVGARRKCGACTL